MTYEAYMGDEDPQAATAALADAPLAQIHVSTHYGDLRTCIRETTGEFIDGCKPTTFHPGVDLVAPEGTEVFAPHDGWLLFAGSVGSQPAFKGYEPSVILLAHDDVSSSLIARLVAKVSPAWWPLGDVNALASTDQSAVYSLIAHVGNVVIKRDFDSRLKEVLNSRIDINSANWRSSQYEHGHFGHVMKFQPGFGRSLAMLNADNQQARYVKKGTLLGNVSNYGHVHWEIRTTPFGKLADDPLTHPEQNQRIDPMLWLHDYKGLLMPEVGTAAIPARESKGGGGIGWLLLLLALASGKRRR